MKSGKKPTRNEKLIISKSGLNPEKWLIFKKTHEVLQLVHRETGVQKTVLI